MVLWLRYTFVPYIYSANNQNYVLAAKDADSALNWIEKLQVCVCVCVCTSPNETSHLRSICLSFPLFYEMVASLVSHKGFSVSAGETWRVY